MSVVCVKASSTIGRRLLHKGVFCQQAPSGIDFLSLLTIHTIAPPGQPTPQSPDLTEDTNSCFSTRFIQLLCNPEYDNDAADAATAAASVDDEKEPLDDDAPRRDEPANGEVNLLSCHHTRNCIAYFRKYYRLRQHRLRQPSSTVDVETDFD